MQSFAPGEMDELLRAVDLALRLSRTLQASATAVRQLSFLRQPSSFLSLTLNDRDGRALPTRQLARGEWQVPAKAVGHSNDAKFLELVDTCRIADHPRLERCKRVLSVS